jgi:chromosome partitioning protein
MSKIILTAHHKGGVGKSILTLNLAKNIGRISDVAIIDFDPQGSLYKTREEINVPVFSYTDFLDKKGNISFSKLEYEYIFIDTPPYIITYFNDLCDIADVILIPMKAGTYDYLSLVETVDRIKGNDNISKTMTIFTMVKANANITSEIDELVKELGIEQAKTNIGDLVAYIYSTSGKLDSNVAQQQIDGLSIEILKRLVKK